MVTQEIKKKVDDLSEEDRASLACYILHGFEVPNTGVSDEAVFERLQELQTGQVKEIDHDSLLKGLKLRDRR